MTGAKSTQEHLKPYAAAILIVCCAVVLATAVRPLLGGRVPQPIFALAVFCAAAYGGLGPGLLATFLSCLLIGWVFRGAVISLVETPPGVATFAILGAVISLIMEQFRRSRLALQRSKDRLEQANIELSRRSEALAVSNEELRRFAYALSHDLQNPLRTVSIFAEHLAARNDGTLDEVSAQSLRFIIEGVGGMQEMIRGLLQYATVMHETAGREERSDCNKVVEAVLADLHGAIAESGARVTVDALPVLAAGAGPLRQLFSNIIANAIKYRNSSAPEIHVSARPNGMEWIFSIRDNGIGIDMRYAEKIFGVFERLHGPSEYSGSGIGLAICRAIVQRYGGRIWVDSELGRGSTFYFTLNSAPKASQKMPVKESTAPS